MRFVYVGCDANASYATYGTPHPAIGEHSDVITQFFNLPLSYLGKTNAGITAKVLDCVKTDWDDEFDFIVEPFIKLNKYSSVMDWFKNAKQDCINEMKAEYAKATPSQRYKYDHTDPEAFRKFFYNRSLTTNICGVPHVDGWGGIHGASEKPIFRKGLILHVDVGSYYPSYLIAHQRITRASRTPEKYKEVYDTRMALKAAGKKKTQALKPNLSCLPASLRTTK